MDAMTYNEVRVALWDWLTTHNPAAMGFLKSVVEQLPTDGTSLGVPSAYYQWMKGYLESITAN